MWASVRRSVQYSTPVRPLVSCFDVKIIVIKYKLIVLWHTLDSNRLVLPFHRSSKTICFNQTLNLLTILLSMIYTFASNPVTNDWKNFWTENWKNMRIYITTWVEWTEEYSLRNNKYVVIREIFSDNNHVSNLFIKALNDWKDIICYYNYCFLPLISKKCETFCQKKFKIRLDLREKPWN